MHMRNIYRPPVVPAEIAGNDPKTWRWIKFQLGMHGLTLADVARDADVRRHTLYAARNSAYPRMETILTSALGLGHPMQIWPHRYTEDGSTVGYMNLCRPRAKSAHSKDSPKGRNQSLRGKVQKVNVNTRVVA